MNLSRPDRKGWTKGEADGTRWLWLGWKVEACNVTPLGKLIEQLLERARANDAQAEELERTKAELAAAKLRPAVDDETNAKLVEARDYLDSLANPEPQPEQ